MYAFLHESYSRFSPKSIVNVLSADMIIEFDVAIEKITVMARFYIRRHYD
jgi:hypothetical protein